MSFHYYDEKTDRHIMSFPPPPTKNWKPPVEEKNSIFDWFCIVVGMIVMAPLAALALIYVAIPALCAFLLIFAIGIWPFFLTLEVLDRGKPKPTIRQWQELDGRQDEQ